MKYVFQFSHQKRKSQFNPFLNTEKVFNTSQQGVRHGLLLPVYMPLYRHNTFLRKHVIQSYRL